MSAPMRLNSDQLRDLAGALDALTTIHARHGVKVDAYGATQIAIGDATIAISWDSEAEQYVIDDRNGS